MFYLAIRRLITTPPSSYFKLLSPTPSSTSRYLPSTHKLAQLSQFRSILFSAKTATMSAPIIHLRAETKVCLLLSQLLWDAPRSDLESVIANDS